MNPTFKIELKQHTPLIHFQYQQNGVTLRATEVKPKLDWFVIKKLGGWDNILSEWKVNPNADENKALNYKLTIQAKDISRNDPNKIAKGFFGNIGNETEMKYLVTAKEIELKIICFVPKLMESLKLYLSDFFLLHNFGARQNRGYGSFSIKDEIGRPSKAQYAFKIYKEDYSSIKSSDLSLITMEAIDWFYRSLRQGINHGTFKNNRFVPYLYMKPMIFQFAASKGIQWEKKTIKEWFFDKKLSGQKNDHYDENPPTALYFSSERKKLVRDVFGLSTEQTWMNYPGANGKPSISKEDVNGEIERYPSPLTFKVIQHPGDEFMTVYFWAIPLEKTYQRASFKIKKDKRSNQKPNLKIWDDFDWSSFFEFAFAKNRLEDSIQLTDNKGKAVEKLLIDIYQDIRNNNFTS